MAVSKLYRLQNRAQRFVLGKLYSRAGGRGVEFDKGRPPGKVLLVIAGLIGDSVMVTPGIIAARQIWKDAHITLLGRRHNSELLAACPLLDEIHTFEQDPLTIRYRHKVRELKRWLRSEKFDVSILLLGDQYAHLTAAAGIPVRVGAMNDWESDCATHNFDFIDPRRWGPPERLNAFRCLGYEFDDILPKLWVGDPAKRSAGEKLRSLGMNAAEEFVVIHPFGSTRLQWWAIDKACELASKIQEEFGLRSVLVGGKETVGIVADCPAIVDTRGMLSLQELVAVIAAARFTVSTDSGPFHIAGALGTETVGLFRSRRPEHAGRYPTATVVFGEYTACSETCEWDRCVADPCRQLSDISVNSVLAETRDRLRRKRKIDGSDKSSEKRP